MPHASFQRLFIGFLVKKTKWGTAICTELSFSYQWVIYEKNIISVKIPFNSSRAHFRFCGKCKMFEIATVLSITHVSMCHTNLWSFPVLYSMPISEFPISSSKNRFALAALFSPFLSHTTMCDHGTVWRETSE